MELADQVFECGRKKGKTYDEVRKTDQEFCQLALRCKELSRFCPEDFKRFLRSFESGLEEDEVKETDSDFGQQAVRCKERRNFYPKVRSFKPDPKVIKEFGAHHFLKRLNPDQFREFETIITGGTHKLPIDERKINEPVDKKNSGYSGIFCRLFLKKCVLYLRQKVEFGSRFPAFPTDYATIFPFEISSNVDVFDIPVKSMIDQEFKNEVNDFLICHFDDVNSERAVDLFLGNICAFRQKYFDDEDVAELNTFIEEKISGSFDLKYNYQHHKLEYLKKFPRLNDAGIRRYQSYNRLYNKIVESYEFPINQVHCSESYYKYMPEHNVYEILSLLDKQLYSAHYKVYVQRFLKYIFFFVHAEKSSKKPVFFIDNLLFECLKHLQSFKTCLDKNPVEQKISVAMLSAVEYRKKSKSFHNVKISDLNLNVIFDYVKSRIANIQNAVVEDEIKTEILQFLPPVRVRDTFYDLTCSLSPKTHRQKFHELIVQAAVHPSIIKKIVRYNPKTGIEYSLNMPERVEDVKNFVAKYNKYDFSVEPPKERFLTWGLEKYFQRETIDWEEKYRKT